MLSFVVGMLVAACNVGDDATITPTTTENCVEPQEGVFLCAADPPMVPPGASVLSGYFEVRSDEDTALVVGLPLTTPQSSEVDIGYYTYSSDGGWTGIIGGIRLVESGTVLEGTFPYVPENIIVLRWPQG